MMMVVSCDKTAIISCVMLSSIVIACYTSSVMKDSVMGSECQLLQPVCLRVAVTRNLSASWYHGRADIEVMGRLQEISVVLFSVPAVPVCADVVLIYLLRYFYLRFVIF